MKETLRQKIRSSVILLPLILPLGIMPNKSDDRPQLVEGYYVSRYGGITKITTDSIIPTKWIDYDNDGKVDEKYSIFFGFRGCLFPVEQPVTQRDHQFLDYILNKAEENNKFP